MSIKTGRKTGFAALLLIIAAVLAGILFFSGRAGGSPADAVDDPVLGAIKVAPADETPETAATAAAPGVAEEQTTPFGDEDFGKLQSLTVKDSDLQSSLAQLALLAESGSRAQMEDFARLRGMDLEDGRVRVVIEAAGGAGEPLVDAAALVLAADGVVESSYRSLLQASVPIESLEELAAASAVSYVREPRTPLVSAYTSEGVADVSADIWQAALHKGAGTKVAVLDLGFSGYGLRIEGGELPANVITASFRADGDINNTTDHGTACAEVVYDMAPEAQLYLVNFETEVELGNAVSYLISQGVDVISASWAWPYAFRGDGSGTVNDIADTATTAGILWVNASGNGALNHWSGAFSDADSDSWHEFSGADEGNNFQGTVSVGSEIYAYLTWDKWPQTDQDYDLYLFKAGNPEPVASSLDWQNGSQEPAEAIYYKVPFGQGGTYYISVRNAGADGNADLELFGYFNSLEYQVAAGSLAGQPADNAAVMTVGAVPVGSTSLASYSSRGPTADGRIKPDITAPTGVSTGTYGPSGFAGTSASTPHVAGAAALLKGAYPGYSSATLMSVLEAGATDLGDPGKDNLFGSGKLAMGAPPPSPVSQYFTWYDQLSPGMRNWVLIGNPSATEADIGSVEIGGFYRGGWQIAAQGRVTPEFPGVMAGPVEVFSPGSGLLLASQRVLFNGNFTEVTAVAASQLDSEYYLAWYDQYSPGMQSWMLVSNQGTQATTAEVYIGDMGTPAGSYGLNPGEMVTPQFPGIIDGPVYVRSTNGQPLVVSQRVTFNGYFSEVMGVPASGLSDEFDFNWYDQLSPGFQTWILVANPTAAPVDAEVFIGGFKQGPTLSLAAGGVEAVSFPGLRDGPVKVRSTGGEQLVVSERTLMGSSFEELQGAAHGSLSTDSWFTWYDQLSGGMTTYILVSNQGTLDTTAEIFIGGVKQGPTLSLAAGTVQALTFPGVMNGPVRVVSGGQPILASQRTVYNSSFNEVDGIIPQ